MNTALLYDAIGEIREEYIKDAETSNGHILKIRWNALVAACLVIAILAVPVRAEYTNGYISNLLAPLYGGAKTELIDKIGVPIGAETTVGDYKLSANAIVGDKYCFAIVYSLTRVDGQPLEEGLYFADYSNSLRSESGGGICEQRLSDDGTTLQIVDKWTSSRGMFLNRNATVQLTDLMKYNGYGQERTLISKGTWKLKFVVRYEDTSIKVPIDDLTVRDASGKQYTIEDIRISPVGIHFDMTVPNPHKNGVINEPMYKGFSLAVVLKDGSVIDVTEWNLGTRGDLNKDYLTADFGAMFEIPISLDEIQAFVICDTTLPL